MGRLRAFSCPIAAKSVGISLRQGGRLQEPAHMYVHCDERDCQYVDLNRAPCPLTPAMFDDGTEERVRAYLDAHGGSRLCYTCLTEAVGVRHDQVRRAAWRLKQDAGASIRPARCAGCQRRAVTLAVGGLTERPIAAASGVDELRTYLRARPGFEFCVHCLARELGVPPAAAREAMFALEREATFRIRTAECVSCLLTKPVIRAEEGPALEHDPRRVVDFLAHAPSDAFCASCIAFSTGLALAEIRRIVQDVAAVPDIDHAEDTCSACGRRQAVSRLRRDG